MLSAFCLALGLPGPALADYVLGGGVEADADDGLSAIVFADVGLGDKTRVYGALGLSSVPLPSGLDLETVYADLGIDYWFDPVGVRLELATWGDSDVFASDDARAAVYWRNDSASLSADFEYREFEFDLFRNDFRPGQDIQFHANGLGLSARFDVTDAVSVSLSGIDYDYNVNLQRAANSDILDFLSVSRLSLINSLVDYRVGAGVAVDIGATNWELSHRSIKGEADRSTTRSTTLSLITPMGSGSDIQLGVGVDDSDLYGSVTFFSVHLFFYGGD